MFQTVEGMYRNGQIELAEVPVGVTAARVIVTFLPVNKAIISSLSNPLPTPARQPRQPGSARGRLTILAEDKDHLQDFREEMR